MKLRINLIIFCLLFLFEARASNEEKCVIEMTSFKGLMKGDIYNLLNPQQSPKDQLLKLCQKNIRCKSLWIRGHFGGEFFNENYSQRLSLEDLETLSCKTECLDFFNSIEEVHLLGCNTLSNNNRDLRTNEEYLNVLRRHGVSSMEAASFSAQRYGLIGKSFKERFQQIFSETNKISGFKGRTTGQEIDQYLKKGKRSANFLTTSGIKRLDQDKFQQEVSNKELTCQLRLNGHEDQSHSNDLIQELVSNGTFFREFDAIKDFLKRNPSWKPHQLNSAKYIDDNLKDLLAEKHSLSFTSQIIFVFKRLGWIEGIDFDDRAMELITRSFKKTLSPESRDAICDPLFRWPTSFLNEMKPSEDFFTDPWRVRALGCLKIIPENWVNNLIKMGSMSKTESIRVEAYRSLGLINSKSPEVLEALKRGQADTSREVRQEANYSSSIKFK